MSHRHVEGSGNLTDPPAREQRKHFSNNTEQFLPSKICKMISHVPDASLGKQAAFILQQLTLDRLEEVGPIIIREALPTVERLSRCAC